MNIEIGKTYRVTHARKGTFTAKVTGLCGAWVDLEVIDGEAAGLRGDVLAAAGDPITVRSDMCLFTRVET